MPESNEEDDVDGDGGSEDMDDSGDEEDMDGLDVDDVSSPFNCTELALPVGGTEQFVDRKRTSRTGRQQRGDLKSFLQSLQMG